MEPWVVYPTGHEISDKICDHLFSGLLNAGYLVTSRRPHHYDPTFEHIPIFYGILRGTGDIIKRRWEEGKPFVYVDHGYMGRGHYDGYYRMVWNLLHPREMPWEPDWESFEKNNWQVRRSMTQEYGKPVIAEPSAYIGEFFGFDPHEWAVNYAEEIPEAVITTKNDGLGKELLKDATDLTTLQSTLAIDALREGIRIYTGVDEEYGPHTPYSHKLTFPFFSTVKGHPNLYLAKLAATQFTLDEIATGKPFKWLERYRP